MTYSLSVIVPAYNESARLGDSLKTVFAYLNQQIPNSEVIIVDDGSEDDTRQVAGRSFAAAGSIATRLIEVRPNKGKGHAVRAGLLAANSPIALFTDADLSTPITETSKLVLPIEENRYDVVFGSRAIDRTLIGTSQPWRRVQAGKVFNGVMRLMTGMPFKDTQCGFKAFRMDVCRPLIEAARIDRFGFDVELLYLPFTSGLRLLEQSVRWNDAEGSKVSTLNGLHAFTEIKQVRRNFNLGLYTEAIARVRRLAATKGDLILTSNEETNANEQLIISG
ncbi:MAG: glycosyltransferase family 2 protein [Pyrinomonadaceae bacterium MAG19_C2-C3]|nr:glycosyltransferase family 2 protein [Pyrinomonadaceae bacterium MAG19_C2-C3]